MQVLSVNDIEAVGGGLTEMQCVGVFGLIGAGVGGVASMSFTAGFGTIGGWSLGGAIGSAAGGLFCAYIADM